MKNIVKYRSPERIEKIKAVLQQQQIHYICIEDDDYPERLKHISKPPPILFYKGDIYGKLSESWKYIIQRKFKIKNLRGQKPSDCQNQ